VPRREQFRESFYALSGSLPKPDKKNPWELRIPVHCLGVEVLQINKSVKYGIRQQIWGLPK